MTLIEEYCKEITDQDYVHTYYGRSLGVKGYPDIAERLILSDYETQTYRDSKLIKGLKVPNEKVFCCPRCKKESTLNVDEILECGKCYLFRYTDDGDTLYIWEGDSMHRKMKKLLNKPLGYNKKE